MKKDSMSLKTTPSAILLIVEAMIKRVAETKAKTVIRCSVPVLAFYTLFSFFLASSCVFVKNFI